MAAGADRAGRNERVALLRGINVGGRNRLSMARLAAIFQALGAEDVETYIQSGNVLYRGGPEVGSIEEALLQELGSAVTVGVRSARALAAVVGACPFPESSRAEVHVGFLAHPAPEAAVSGLALKRYPAEEVVLVPTEAYFYLPHGMGRAKLPAYLDRHLPMTIRNWATTTALARRAAERSRA